MASLPKSSPLHSPTMAPPPPLPPELIDDTIAEILLRLPADEPQCLFRTSLVCKPWRRLLTDAGFLRQYRRFHRSPPLLGLFSFIVPPGDAPHPCFIPTTAPSPFPKLMLNCRSWLSIDCRHGRVLLQHMEIGSDGFIVWDPITGDRKELDLPLIPHTCLSAAVLCAAPGCDHRDCHDGPFLVVCVCTDADDDNLEGLVHACVYSSQVASWGTSVSVPIDADYMYLRNRGAIAGDGVYFMLGMDSTSGILKYDMPKHYLSFIGPPESYKNGIFIVPTEDGLLGVAGVRGSILYLWSRTVNAEGVEGWMQYRVVELQTLFPDDKLLDKAMVIAFAEGVRVIFMQTSRGTYIIDLNSEDVRTISEPDKHYDAIPFTNFYTPDCACGKLPLPAETN